ncbi:MAG: hypothetical protein H0T71_15620 [Acidobacteria bacterium]|nr:hypothetical protein [Acidobacteriota bacterium]
MATAAPTDELARFVRDTLWPMTLVKAGAGEAIGGGVDCLFYDFANPERCHRPRDARLPAVRVEMKSIELIGTNVAPRVRETLL